MELVLALMLLLALFMVLTAINLIWLQVQVTALKEQVRKLRLTLDL